MSLLLSTHFLIKRTTSPVHSIATNCPGFRLISYPIISIKQLDLQKLSSFIEHWMLVHKREHKMFSLLCQIWSYVSSSMGSNYTGFICQKCLLGRNIIIISLRLLPDLIYGVGVHLTGFYLLSCRHNRSIPISLTLLQIRNNSQQICRVNLVRRELQKSFSRNKSP